MKTTINKPNLLFIYTDEQAFNTLAAYGNSQIEMPNLNRLAEQSVVFNQAYVTQPVCTPSRSTLLTGLYPHANGCTENNVPLSLETPCLPEMLSDGNYRTAHFGKWHLGDELYAQHGFQEWVGVEDGYTHRSSEGKDKSILSGYHHFLVDNGFTPRDGKKFGRDEAARLPEEYSKPAFLAREASRFLLENRNNPFVLYVNFLEPHMPYFGPRDDQYDPKKMPLPHNFEAEFSDSQPLKTRVFAEAYREWGHSGMPLRTPEHWQRIIANYWGLCSLIDTHIGAILDTLEESGLSDNTIVVFTSDHGDMMGSHRLIAKCVMFEEAARVPLMIRLPGQKQGKHVSGPVSQIDVVPTLLDLMDHSIPQQLQGESLRELLETDNAISTRNAFIEWNGPNSGIVGEATDNFRLPSRLEGVVSCDELKEAITDSVRTVISPDGWKLNCSPLGEHELYDLNNDPGETVNIFAENKEPARKLREEIVTWQQETGDTVELPLL
ncbi:MAG: sulfatase-like hydrolase/transferase [Verrucomicrobia bacterium]|jgi:arylsulfatase A-like enzyme|nr:sulfatase-like hydrolase/transferase [Verrucomicrobiota bacterium]